ncbi:Dehydrogenase/reductase SDR family member 4 [Hondaea fermentalgiana]|uniref:Dehydrogenase/reductase SDR family member 4 n=1 Tax=Hondaea fermentalgiana TaxID=2315210 RepID=A0A2R5GKD3_9STRA|nr:Dehydrogenase/reductase SDR family member 4 [Hondaea fermentalgiana]|eukprot:GBG30188.1 Dehydrogenase/reductase SDR family member 4 [Hondaea fermentalgiana]
MRVFIATRCVVTVVILAACTTSRKFFIRFRKKVFPGIVPEVLCTLYTGQKPLALHMGSKCYLLPSRLWTASRSGDEGLEARRSRKALEEDVVIMVSQNSNLADATHVASCTKAGALLRAEEEDQGRGTGPKMGDELVNHDDVVQVAILTGSTGVLGGAMARGLAARGANVVITSREQQQCDDVAGSIRESGGSAIGVVADVTKEEDLVRLRDETLAKWGKIDILVNAAGGNKKEAVVQPDGSFFDVPIDAVRGVMDLNFAGTVLPCIILGKAIAESEGGGTIVNIGSMAAEKATLTRVMGYSASKAAVTNFTRWLSVELAKKHGEKVRVNALAPGFFLGEQNRALLTNPDGSYSARGEDIVRGTPMNRFGQAEELVGPLVWLCSDASKFVTGAIIPIDGGFSVYSGV